MAAEPVLRSLTEAEIAPELHRQLIALLSTCFQGPHDSPFRVQSYWRKPPDRRWILFDPAGLPIAQVTVHLGTAHTAAGPLRTGDIADVCVDPGHRGRGYVRLLLGHAHEWLKTEGVPFAFLTGNPAVYGGSGYLPVTNPIRYFDPIADAWKEGPVTNAMVCPLGNQPWPAGLIDWGGQMY